MAGFLSDDSNRYLIGQFLKAEAKLSGFWYRWLKWRRGDEIYEEAATTDEERELLDPEGFEKKDSDI